VSSKAKASRHAFSDAVADFFVSKQGMPASTGRIAAALLLSAVPLSQAQLRAELSLSDGSVSEGIRLLMGVGLVERSGDPRARPAYFQVVGTSWAGPAYDALDNVQVSLALSHLAVQHFEEHEGDNPNVAYVAAWHAMFECIAAEMPALVDKALEAGARAHEQHRKRAAAG